MKYLLTYTDALKISKAYSNHHFKESNTLIDGYNVSTFTCFMCAPEWFKTPLKEDPVLEAYDMKGITFVLQPDGKYKRFFMLPKFFNLNQIPETELNVLEKKTIDYVTTKEDGSLVGFMQLPNGVVFTKTQRGFTNEQSVAAMKLYEQDSKLQTFVLKSLKSNHTPLFEYVSYDNRIVICYDKKELRLIGIRCNETGNFIPGFKLDYTPHARKLENVHSLVKLVEQMRDLTNTEGCVVRFTDGTFIKIKTPWYFKSHGIRTEHVFREDHIIKYYLEDKLDDVMQELSRETDKDAFAFIEKVKTSIDNYLRFIEDKVQVGLSDYKNFKNFQTFATAYYNFPFFNLIRTKLERPEEYNSRKIELVLYNTRKLKKAKDIVNRF